LDDLDEGNDMMPTVGIQSSPEGCLPEESQARVAEVMRYHADPYLSEVTRFLSGRSLELAEKALRKNPHITHREWFEEHQSG